MNTPEFYKFKPPLFSSNGFKVNDNDYVIPSNGLFSKYLEFEYQEVNGFRLIVMHFDMPSGNWKFTHKEDDYYCFKNKDYDYEKTRNLR